MSIQTGNANNNGIKIIQKNEIEQDCSYKYTNIFGNEVLVENNSGDVSRWQYRRIRKVQEALIEFIEENKEYLRANASRLFARDDVESDETNISLQAKHDSWWLVGFYDDNEDGLPDFINVRIGAHEPLRLSGVDFQPFIASVYEFVTGYRPQLNQ